MYSYMVSYLATIIYGYIGMNQAMITYLHMITYKSPWLYNRMLTYLSRRSNQCIGLFKRFEKLGELIEIPKRIIGNKQRFALWTRYFLIYQHYSCFRLQRFVIVLGVIHKDNIALLYHMYLIHTQYRKGFISHKGTIDNSGYLF